MDKSVRMVNVSVPDGWVLVQLDSQAIMFRADLVVSVLERRLTPAVVHGTVIRFEHAATIETWDDLDSVSRDISLALGRGMTDGQIAIPRMRQ